MSSSKGAPTPSAALKPGDPKKTQEPPLPEDGKGEKLVRRSGEHPAVMTPARKYAAGGMYPDFDELDD